MKAYYFISPTGSEFLYISSILLSYRHIKDYDPHHKFSPEILRNFKLAESNGRLSRYAFEKRGWDFEVMDISDKMVEDFMNSCFRRRSKRRLNNRASKIFDWAFSHSSIALDNGLRDGDEYEDCEYDSTGKTVVHEGGYEESLPFDDYEDIADDWWNRGEEPPF